MEITYTISREDYWQFQWFYILHRPAHRWSIVLNFLAGTVVAAAIEWRLDASVTVIAISAPVIGALLVITLLRIEKRRVMGVPSERGDILGEHFFRIDAEGLVERTKTRNSLTQWDGILDIAANKNYIFMFVDAHQAFIVPKRAFERKENVQAFLDTAMSHWKASKVVPTAVDRYGYPVKR